MTSHYGAYTLRAGLAMLHALMHARAHAYCVYIFHIVFTVNNDCFIMQRLRIDICDGPIVCSL